MNSNRFVPHRPPRGGDRPKSTGGAGDPPAGTEDRRSFLKLISALGSGLVALLAGIPAVTAFVSPAVRKRTTDEWLALGETDFFDWDVPNRIDMPMTVQDAWVESRVLRSMWVYTQDGENFTVYNGRCTHLGCQYAYQEEPMPEFHEEPNVFHCPCHHAIFEPDDGRVIRGPAPRPLDTLETRIEDGVLYARYEDFRVGIPDKVPV
jgi:quinol---cytochrome c reductase iron-sulfur subunit, bacillus type